MAASGHKTIEAANALSEMTKLAEQCRRDGEFPLCYLDVDGTLLDNRPRTLAIIREFAASIDGPIWLKRAISALGISDIRYGIADTLSEACAKDLKTDKEYLRPFSEALRTFWEDRFFTNAYQAFDVPIPGALEFVRSVAETDIPILYLTGRDKPNMGHGFLASLERHGFPLPGQAGKVDAILKPKFADKDAEFKRGVLAEHLANKRRPVFFIDDNTDNVNLAPDFCGLSVLLVSSQVSNLITLDPRAHVMHSFTTAS